MKLTKEEARIKMAGDVENLQKIVAMNSATIRMYKGWLEDYGNDLKKASMYLVRIEYWEQRLRLNKRKLAQAEKMLNGGKQLGGE